MIFFRSFASCTVCMLGAVFALLSAPLFASEKAGRFNLIPAPAHVRASSGSFEITAQTRVFVTAGNDTAKRVAEHFVDALNRVTGFELFVAFFEARPQPANSIAFVLSNRKAFGEEGYTLSITKKRVVISASGAHGLFYGVQTLLQLLPAEAFGDPVLDVRWKMPCVEIEDQPRFRWRGMHLDVSRHFFPKEFIKRYIDLIAMHKMNVFHWDLTNDNGWRIEVKKHPKLTEVCAWRVDREQQHWLRRDPPREDEKATYGGFYTQEEVKEILAYAAERFVTVLPAIELPGHTSEVFAAYPELSCRGEKLPVQVGSYWPNVDIFCAGNDSVFTFIDDVLTEIAALFPNQYIHIGGDEADKTRWRACAKCQARMKQEGLQNEHELQSYFIKRVEKMLSAKGKKLIGWDEILEGGLAPEATVMSWRGAEGGIAAAQQGHDAVMSPVSHCYFDYYQANPQFEPEAIGGYTTLKKVYSYEPLPQELTPEEAKHILGAQGNVWTEYIATPQHAEYMSVPRMSALAEVVWSPKEGRNWKDFQQRLPAHFRRFDAMRVNYSKGSFTVAVQTGLVTNKRQMRVQLESEQPHAEIRYTLDGSAPTMQSPLYRKPFVLNRTATIHAAICGDEKMQEEVTRQEVSVHRALGAKVSYAVPPSAKYFGGRELGLVDGLRGNLQARNETLWQGFEGEDAEVTIDLGKPSAVAKLSATFGQQRAWWIFLPSFVEYFISNDGKNFESVAKVEHEVSVDQEGALIHDFTTTLAAPKHCRYVRMKAKSLGVCPPGHPGAGGKAWVFVDEIAVD